MLPTVDMRPEILGRMAATDGLKPHHWNMVS